METVCSSPLSQQTEQVPLIWLPAFSSSCLVRRLPSFRKVHSILKGLGYKAQFNPLQRRDGEGEGEKQSVRCYRVTGRGQCAQVKIANWLNPCSWEAGAEKNDTWQILPEQSRSRKMSFMTMCEGKGLGDTARERSPPQKSTGSTI